MATKEKRSGGAAAESGEDSGKLRLIDRFAVIEKFLGAEGDRGARRNYIRMMGSRADALLWVKKFTGEIFKSKGPGDPVTAAKAEGLVLQGYAEVIPWDEVIDEAIDVDAGAERWDPPKGTLKRELQPDHSARNGHATETPRAADPPGPIPPDPAGGVSTSTPGGIQLAAAKGDGGLAKKPWDEFAPTAEGTVLTEKGPVSGKGARLPNGKPVNRKNVEASASPAPLDPASVGAAVIQVKLIDPNPWQPRLEFDEADIASLARSLKTHGLVQAITVRPSPKTKNRFELVDGERRLRAARVAGLATVVAIVRQVSDEEMAELALVANDDRKELNPVERARSYQRMLRERGWTQQQLAERLQRSQSFVANAVRLLELPTDWQARLISGAMSESHAKELLRIAKFPDALEALEEDLADQMDQEGEETGGTIPALTRFRMMVFSAIQQAAAADLSIETMWDPRLGRNVPVVTPTPEQLAELGVVEWRREKWRGEERVHRFVTNAKLFEKLQATYVASLPKAKPPVAKAKGGSREKPKAVDSFSRDAEKLRDNWRLWLIAKNLQARKKDDPIFERMGLVYVLSADTIDLFNGAVKAQQAVLGRKEGRLRSDVDWDLEIARSALRLSPQETRALWRDIVVAQFAWNDKTGPACLYLDPEVCEALLEGLGVEPLAEWRKDFCGPLTAPFFKLHTKERLVALGAELGVFVSAGKSTEIIVKQIKASANTRQKLPACLRGPELQAEKKPAKKKGAKR